jgi:hypothetical protein
MPILDLGYRGWNGPRLSSLHRCWAVAASGIALVWRDTRLRRLLLVSLAPAMLAAGGFFLYEQSVAYPELRAEASEWLLNNLERPELAEQMQSDPGRARHAIWSLLLLWFFRYPQAFFMVIVIGMVGPKLISHDLRSRGYLLYLSRSLHPLEYMLGKAFILWFLLVMLTTLPALVVFVGGVLLSADLWVLLDTWDLPLRVVAATVVLALPTTAVALCYSSLTSESRFASFAWFTTWIIGWVTYGTIRSFSALTNQELRGSQPTFEALVSPYHTLGMLQAGVFGSAPISHPVVVGWGLWLVLTSIALWVTYRRLAGLLIRGS